jgi:uncharacterized protein (DUF433 family)
MIEAKTTDTIPLTAAPGGVLRIGGTRVSLDTLISAFRDGATPEEIVQQYPGLQLGDVYEVIGYALRHTEEVEAYLTERQNSSAEVRATNERRAHPDGIRERLLARRT